MDYVDRLKKCGKSEDDALFIADEFLRENDQKGLEDLIRRLEHPRVFSRAVIEEVLTEVGLEKI